MDKEFKLKTHWKTQITQVHCGIDFALSEKLPALLDEEERKVVIITDTHVEKLYHTQMEHLDVKIFSFPAGEASKTRETKSMLEDHLLSHNFGRDSLIIGLGGGVVGDVTGFLAANYCRGIAHIQIPTSLIAMVDASIGGKTAVNTAYGKNMIGAFYPPEAVWIDGAFLATLPQKQKKSGIVEMIKAGLIESPSLFDSMKENVDKWETHDLEFIMDRIYESVTIKRDIVEDDPEEEKGSRRILNFGHTFGHALEMLEDYQIDHGEAVAIGILVASFISNKMGLLPKEAFDKVREIFQLYQIPLKISMQHSLDDWMSALALDKKALKGTPRLVLLEEIGRVAPFNGNFCSEVEFPLLEEAITWIYEQFCHSPK
ncbi:MAG: 3-dehydroquinate synthase [Chlamydiae bacterium]|nr:3-dehydroquinate synthase [Chlamydiota bacterium]